MIDVDVVRCACGNPVGQGVVLCEWCEGHQDCVVPVGVRVYSSRFSGGPVATCRVCGYVWGYWDCPCELSHTCEPV